MIQITIISSLFIFLALLLLICKPNLIFVLFALEIILLGVNLNFIFGSILLDDFMGQAITLILFTIAALDTSIGLVIIV